MKILLQKLKPLINILFTLTKMLPLSATTPHPCQSTPTSPPLVCFFVPPPPPPFTLRSCNSISYPLRCCPLTDPFLEFTLPDRSRCSRTGPSLLFLPYPDPTLLLREYVIPSFTSAPTTLALLLGLVNRHETPVAFEAVSTLFRERTRLDRIVCRMEMT
ncbi:hypothetical protein BCR33DRAFT_159899 [Rhizoclosmatium globosum]|uniref:Uncharacterized protein n=1 Tax=Rhizoclosmatium globosum TaxID=329046 RepID=A0A1Y2CG98_9FUNG|nr:hypothetical protein BCR33DRAFT_159899 [Rhizoclosmatium globosum]|eukprot:ORY46070.1 hypothetical protein BCR33DRAFT_159899 [Rhizoclosmatium globosum]